MSNKLGHSAHADRKIRMTIACWLRLLDIHLAAAYLSVGESTVRDWIADNLITAVSMPGSTLRDQKGNIVVSASRRRIAKILIDRANLDRLIDQRKGA